MFRGTDRCTPLGHAGREGGRVSEAGDNGVSVSNIPQGCSASREDVWLLPVDRVWVVGLAKSVGWLNHNRPAVFLGALAGGENL